MKPLGWNEKGIRISRKFLPNRRFLDDIVLFLKSTNDEKGVLKKHIEAGKKTNDMQTNGKKSLLINSLWSAA